MEKRMYMRTNPLDLFHEMDRRERQEARHRYELAEKRRGDGRGFVGDPTRTLCFELRGNDTVIPIEAWTIHGEEVEELDAGFPFRDSHDPEVHHMDLENLSEEDLYPDREDFLMEDEREMNRDPEWDPRRVAKAGAKLIETLELSRTRAMCDVVGAYLGRLEYRMDGVIYHCLSHKHDKDVVESVLEFSGKMNKYRSEISEKARRRLIAEAQIEQQREKRIDGSALRLGKALFGGHFNLFLRATI